MKSKGSKYILLLLLLLLLIILLFLSNKKDCKHKKTQNTQSAAMIPNSCVETKSKCEAECKGYRCNQGCVEGRVCGNIESNCYGTEDDCKNTCKGYRCQNSECKQGTTPCTAQEIKEEKCFLSSTCGTGCVATCQTGYIRGTSGTDVCIPSVKPKCVSSDNNYYYYKVAGKSNNDTWGNGNTCHSEDTNCRWKTKNDCQSEFENINKWILGNKDVVNSDSNGPRCQENKQTRLGNDDPWKDDLNEQGYKWWLHITGDFNKTNLTAYNPPSPDSGTCWSGDNWRSSNWSCKMWKTKADCEQELSKKFFLQ